MRLLTSSLCLLTVLWSFAAHADIAVFDRGGGDVRTNAARAAAANTGETVLTAAESAELDIAYATGCADAACYSRAGVAGSVATIVLVEKAALTVVDVEHTLARTRPAATANIATVFARLREPQRWGTLDTVGLPAGSTVVVNGAVYDGSDLAPGDTAVVVRDGNGVEHALRVVVVGGQPTRVELPAPAAPAASTPVVTTSTAGVPLYAIPLLATGGALTVAGLTVGVVAELRAQDALTKLQADDPADLRTAETVEVAAFVVAAVGVAGLVGGALLLFNNTDANADSDTGGLETSPNSP